MPSPRPKGRDHQANAHHEMTRTCQPVKERTMTSTIIVEGNLTSNPRFNFTSVCRGFRVSEASAGGNRRVGRG